MSKADRETSETAFIRAEAFGRRHTWAAGYQEIPRKMPFQIEPSLMTCLPVLLNRPYHLKTFLQGYRRTFTTVSINLIINCAKTLVTSIIKSP